MEEADREHPAHREDRNDDGFEGWAFQEEFGCSGIAGAEPFEQPEECHYDGESDVSEHGPGDELFSVDENEAGFA